MGVCMCVSPRPGCPCGQGPGAVNPIDYAWSFPRPPRRPTPWFPWHYPFGWPWYPEAIYKDCVEGDVYVFKTLKEELQGRQTEERERTGDTKEGGQSSRAQPVSIPSVFGPVGAPIGENQKTVSVTATTNSSGEETDSDTGERIEKFMADVKEEIHLSLIHISEPTRPY